MNIAETSETVRSWPVEEQLDLVFRLWDQITNSGWQPTASPELLDELQRRLAKHEADPSRVLTWDEVMAHVKRDR